jgi:cysteine desulfurase
MTAKRRVYLDWNATAPLRPEARSAMLAAMEIAGNPSSVHAEGRAARALIERARAEVAAAVGCAPGEVVFTSGATEAAAVLGRLPAGHGVLAEPTVHDCLWAQTRSGAAADRPSLTFAMGLANNETGVVTEPPTRGPDGRFDAAGQRADRLMLDVAQAVGRLPWSFAWSGADMAIVSAHKLGGPKGAGALILRAGLDITPVLAGGGQETGRRAGTENVVGIAGFAAAATAAARDLAEGRWERVAQLRNILEEALSDPRYETNFVGKAGPRLPNTSCLIAPGWKGETQVMAMDLAGFAVSAGAACSSGKVRESRVLRAMGYGEAAGSAIRVSLGPDTTEGDVLHFAETWGRARLRQLGRVRR